jgi:hypothetical protein
MLLLLLNNSLIIQGIERAAKIRVGKEEIMKKFFLLVVCIIIFSIPLMFGEDSNSSVTGKSLIELRTYDQIKNMLKLKLKPFSERANVVRFNELYLKSLKLPSSYDLRDQNILTPIKDQANCGGCWAFAPIGLFEGLIKQKITLTTDLSEQQVLDCAEGDCDNGGWPPDALEYLVTNGVVLEKFYPLTWTDKACTVSRASDYYLTDWKEADVWNVPLATRIQTIKSAIYNYGPVVVAFEVTAAFNYYHGGIYTYTGILSDPNHSVCLVGWVDDASVSNGGYWIARNSWGASWGESGYFRVAYDTSYIDSYLCAYGIYNTGNMPPQFNDPISSSSGQEGTKIVIDASATDPEDEPISYSASNLPTGAAFNTATGRFEWTPTYVQSGTYVVAISANDGNSANVMTVTIIVQNVKSINK